MTLVSERAIVTGGSAGIGLRIAGQLLTNGASVVIMARNEGRLHEAEAALSGLVRPGRSVLAIPVDVGDEASIGGAWTGAEEALGGPAGIIVNSAGSGQIKRLLDWTVEEWDEMFAVHARGAFLCTTMAARSLVAAAIGGSIIHITSLNWEAAAGGVAPYCAAKAAVTQFVKVAAAELGRYQIRINAIAPGIVVTPMSEEYLHGAMRDEFLQRTPLGRLGMPQDIGDVAVFLSSREAHWINGASIPVDGGGHVHGLHDFADTIKLPETALPSEVASLASSATVETIRPQQKEQSS